MALVNKKLARLNEVKARAAVRTRRRLAEQDEAAEVQAEAERQAAAARDSEKTLLSESKKAQKVNPEAKETK